MKASTKEAIRQAQMVGSSYAKFLQERSERLAAQHSGLVDERLRRREQMGSFFSEQTSEAVVEKWSKIDTCCGLAVLQESQQVERKHFLKILADCGVHLSSEEKRALQRDFSKRAGSGPMALVGVDYKEFLRCCIGKDSG
jgi:hypothetical protein